MKPPWAWIESDILALITNKVREDHTIDYKACGALLPSAKKNKQQVIEEISKDVSAFANSAGGTIAYGVIDDKNLPVAIDSGYDPNQEVTKEWLEQVINSNIKRRINGVRINTVDISNPPGKVIYIVDIPQSNRAPHMAADHKFYKRFNFESVPMEEYEVRDTAHRSEAGFESYVKVVFSNSGDAAFDGTGRRDFE
jgi:predicted HTH transcriptional regulator